jgi:uncharacterized protein YecT (DUF1311 family)
MIGFLLLVSAVQADLPPQDKGSPCPEPASSENKLSECAHQNYLDADRALNIQWRRTAAVVRPLDATAFTHLLNAQRAWMRYRDETCGGLKAFLSGATADHNYFDCMEAMTEERTAELKRESELWRAASRLHR